jgi:hypothetical protein
MEEKTMTNKRNWLGILAIVLIFGMTVVGCDNGSTNGNGSTGNGNGGSGGTNSALNGTWIGTITDYGDYGEMRMNNGNYDFFAYNNIYGIVEKGKYAVSGNIINISPTHYTVKQMDDDFPVFGSTQFEMGRLYSREEVKSILQITTDEELNNIVWPFAPTSWTYFSNENKFIYGVITYTRQ